MKADGLAVLRRALICLQGPANGRRGTHFVLHGPMVGLNPENTPTCLHHQPILPCKPLDGVQRKAPPTLLTYVTTS